MPQPGNLARARRFTLVWAVPAAALLIGGYLGVTSLVRRGPEITIAFASAQGIKAGTKVAHKDVQLGTVTAVALAGDMNHIEAHVRMTSDAEPFLTDQARFWVVRPTVSGGTVSGLNTLVSGSFIEMDPGHKGGDSVTEFNGLESPPGLRSDEPGTTFKLHAPTVASLAAGTPIYFRDVPVGEVLDNHLSEGTAEITADVFVKAPFDRRVRTGSVWWQASGISTTLEPQSLRVEVTSVAAALSGGLAFSVPSRVGETYPVAAAGTTFPLFGDQATAFRASRSARLSYVTFFDAGTPGLATGSPVQLYGRQVGEVTDVQVQSTGSTFTPRIRVAFDVLPGGLFPIGDTPIVADAALTTRLVEKGLRAELVTLSYIAGTQAVSLDFTGQNAPPPPRDAGVVVLPGSGGGGVPGMLASASAALDRLQHFPFAATGNTARGALAAASAALGGLNPDKQARAMTATLQGLRDTIRSADASLGPMLQNLPGQADGLQRQLAAASQALASADTAYGSGSSLPGDVSRKLADYYDTIRYVRLLADYLVRHPEAIARGTTARGSER